MIDRGFGARLDDATVEELSERARSARGHVLTMTTLADSGHPGGSFSAMEILLTLFHFANLRAEEPRWPDRDRIVVSNGHISPGVYMALADAGFFDPDDAVAHFRQAGSPFEGHVERSVPGVEWSTGNLGQGLSAAVGFALGARMLGKRYRTFAVMSDAEQNKGQVGEARRLAALRGLTDLTVVVDWNRMQLSGTTAEILPIDVEAGFRADGWRVAKCDGHDFRGLYQAISEAVADDRAPTAILAQTHMGHPISFMLDKWQYHGKALTEDEYARAMAELGLPEDLERAKALRGEPVRLPHQDIDPPRLDVRAGTPREYTADAKTDNRSAWGDALVDLAEANPELPIAVFDCDLKGSVKTEGFEKARPDGFVECGVGEHNAAATAGALSTTGVLTFWSDFGVFGIDEPYNQQRLNDINRAGLKLAVTHCGLDVGEDGKTHQCLDYVGALRDFFGWKVVVPADPNQTDRAVRWAARQPGNVCVAMGRSKLPVILAEDGAPAFGSGYEFAYGVVDWVRSGEDVVLLAMGTVSAAAVAAADTLRADGVSVAVGIAASPLELPDEAMRRASSARLLVTAEDHSVRSGLGMSVAEWLALNAVSVPFRRLGVTSYQTSGAAKELLRVAGLDADGIAASIRDAYAAL